MSSARNTKYAIITSTCLVQLLHRCLICSVDV